MTTYRKRTGDMGEQIAVEYLEKLGFKVLQRNFSTKVGEIDIVARAKDKTVVFVEVKTMRNVFRERRLPARSLAQAGIAQVATSDGEFERDVDVSRETSTHGRKFGDGISRLPTEASAQVGETSTFAIKAEQRTFNKEIGLKRATASVVRLWRKTLHAGGSVEIENKFDPAESVKNVSRETFYNRFLNLFRKKDIRQSGKADIESGNRQSGNYFAESITPEDQMSDAKIKKFKRAVEMFHVKHPEMFDERNGFRLDVLAIEILSGSALSPLDGKVFIASSGEQCLVRHYENIF